MREYLSIESQFINPNISLPNSWAPLHVAVLNKNKISAQILIDEYHSNVNISGKNKSSPLHIASQLSDISMIQFLLEKGSNPNQPDGDFNSPLMKAIESNNFKAVEILIQAGADYTMPNKNKNTPLHFACKYGSKEIVELLLSQNVEINTIDNTDSTPLYYAVDRQDPIITKILVDNGADPLMRNIDGKSIFSLAKTSEMISILRNAVSNSEIFRKRKEITDKIENNTSINDSNTNDIECDDLIKLDFSSSDDNEDNEIFKRNDQFDENQFYEFNEEEEEEEEFIEMTEYEENEFLAFKQSIESKIFHMQTAMTEQIGEMIKMIKVLIQKRNDLMRMSENKKLQKKQA